MSGFTVAIQRRQLLRNTALLSVALISDVAFGDREIENLPATIADDAQPDIFLHISPSGEFFYYWAACNT